MYSTNALHAVAFEHAVQQSSITLIVTTEPPSSALRCVPLRSVFAAGVLNAKHDDGTDGGGDGGGGDGGGGDGGDGSKYTLLLPLL